MLNKIFLMGRLVVEPELRYTPTNTPVTTFRIAVDRDFKDKETGERKADFISVVAWRNTAEFVARNFRKGRMIVVVGSLQIRDWTDKDGNKRISAEVVADNVYFADSKRESATAEASSAPSSSYAPPQAAHGGFEELSEDDGELPFN